MEPIDPQEPVKDPDVERPIASGWRQTFRDIVDAFVRGDYALTRGIPSVAPVSAAHAERIRMNIIDYGETLTALSDETWKTSVAQWLGSYWDVLVDLWTVESGRSDLALITRVSEGEQGYRIEIVSVHVP